ncbi:CRISPR-associated helicase Cas3' [Neoactinobaculum massilliense]|uniref:CRISPR-associated helicase Cas3' n=1 Tax=Neoactinobaculum massilliense TaxID=2364794 RepID=UPI000F54703D|nr:CRISPR-associated helicase Cas3' [Neoactinobaculum massilliense]
MTNEPGSEQKVHPHRAIWAKQSGLTGTYPLAAHLLDTATIAGALYDLWLRPGLRALINAGLGGAHARSIVQWITGTHDVGKASPVFQYQPRQKGEPWPAVRERILAEEPVEFSDRTELLEWANVPAHRRHERVSALTLAGDTAVLRKSNAPAAGRWLTLPSLGHHGRFTLPFDGTSGVKFIAEDFDYATTELGWGHVRQDLLDLVSAGCGISSTDLPERVSPVVTVLLSGLTVLADRIASGTEWVVRGTEMVDAGQISLDRPREWIQTRGLEAPARLESTVGIYHDWGSPAAAQHAILHDYSPRPLQEAARTTGGGLWIAMAPTGVGKTEAALLRHSTRAERLLFLLPTQATTNAMMARVQEAFQGTHNVGALAHGMARTASFYQQAVTTASTQSADRQDGTSINDDGGLYPTEFVRSGSSRLLAPVCVATVDQALFAALPAKWTHLRLLALANAHVVVDEAHTLDQYQSQLFTDLLTWLGATGTRVTVLTATLPSWQRRAFTEAYANHEPEAPTEFPSAEEVPPRGLQALPQHTDPPAHVAVAANPRIIALHLDHTPIDDMVAGHVEWIRAMRAKYPRARIGLICNTVARAQQVAAECPDALVLHSRMTAAHRNRSAAQLEAELGKNGDGEGTLVIGTQVIEASLDIDLDLLRTELCPAPSLIQRVGRSWRREDPKRSTRVPGLSHPSLSVAAITSTSTNGWETKPYFRAELKRVEAWLTEHSTLRVPEDCQDFIDSCAATLETLQNEDDDALDEFAAHALAASRGENARIELMPLLDDSMTELGDFVALTLSDVNDEEASTRLIDDPATPAILCGDPAVIPGAWDGDPAVLQRIAGKDQATVTRALEGSINIPRSIVAKLDELGKTVALNESPSLLSRYKAVSNAEYLYDPRLGLIAPTTERETS